MTPMPIDFHDIDPNRVAAILYRPQDDVDGLLAEFAQNLVRSGERVGGVVQRNIKDGGGCHIGMEAIDLMTGAEISICQPLGSGAMACKLDAAGLAEAAVAVTRAIAADVDLVVINKFSKQEAVRRRLARRAGQRHRRRPPRAHGRAREMPGGLERFYRRDRHQPVVRARRDRGLVAGAVVAHQASPRGALARRCARSATCRSSRRMT
ncbi:DUF2478 domain-containing protein [Bradyrhizobium guangxiense]